jgi:glycosyltransferase involved in cell wall biosynthesis
MACGLPVIVSKRGGLPYIVKNNINGYVSEFGDVRDLREKIKNLLKSKKLRKKFEKAGKKMVKKYCWDNIVKMYEDIYKK